MGVSFQCECGKRLRVREDQIEDKVKCPDCRKVLVVREKVGDLSARALKRAEDDAPTTVWPLWLLIVGSIGILLFIYKTIGFLQW